MTKELGQLVLHYIHLMGVESGLMQFTKKEITTITLVGKVVDLQQNFTEKQ